MCQTYEAMVEDGKLVFEALKIGFPCQTVCKQYRGFQGKCHKTNSPKLKRANYTGLTN